MQELIREAQLNPARIIFPESKDERVVKAVAKIKELNIAEPVLFVAKEERDRFPEYKCLDPLDEPILKRYAQIYYQLRKKKGISLDSAKKLLKDNPVFTAALMVREGEAEAFIAGASHTTKDVAKAVIYCIGSRNGGAISSCFIIDTGRKEFGYEGKFIFADCGIIISPTPRQLAEIAINSGELFRKLFKKEPYVAFLSYSTYGSASGETVEKIREALRMVRELRGDIKVDGELQADAAIVEDVAKIKCPRSEVAGKANVLIFPELNSGNICYKLVDRLLNAIAVGPIFLGTLKPVSDLSRGCEVEEIVLVSAVISIMAKTSDSNVDSDIKFR